jgi:hypothetical protein
MNQINVINDIGLWGGDIPNDLLDQKNLLKIVNLLLSINKSFIDSCQVDELGNVFDVHLGDISKAYKKSLEIRNG